MKPAIAMIAAVFSRPMSALYAAGSSPALKMNAITTGGLHRRRPVLGDSLQRLSRLTLLLGALAWSAAAADRPNVLLIVSDDQGYADVGFQGCKDIPTPHLDRLAREGIHCTSGYVTQTNHLAAQQSVRVKEMADLLQRISDNGRNLP